MKIRTIIASIAMLASSAAMAQYDLNAAAEGYRAEVDESVKKMEGSGNHNLAPEPFKEFIAKFSTDSAFMESRTSLTEADKEKFAPLLTPSTFEAKAPVIADNNGTDDVYYQIWDEMQFHTVHLDCCWDGVLEYVIIFERKSGRWHLTQILQ